MAARTTKIVLDGQDYEIPTLSIDQLERLATLFADPETQKLPGNGSFRLFAIVTEDIRPAPPEGQKLRCSGEEMRTALATILKDAGLTEASGTENPPKPAAPASPAQT